MTNFSKNKKFISAVLFQIAVIFIIIIFKVLTLNRAEEILLRIKPADLKNPMRGNYIILEYDISKIPQSYFSYSPIKIGDNVFVPLIKKDGYFVSNNKASKNSPKNGIFIKGWVKETEKINPVRGREVSQRTSTSNRVNEINCFLTKDCLFSNPVKMIYGIEEYYVPENKGNELVSSIKNNDTFAAVAVDNNGNAVIKGIFINNKLWP